MPDIAEIIAEHIIIDAGYWSMGYECRCGDVFDENEWAEHVAEAIREAHTISTVEELDALPEGTAVRMGGNCLIKPPHVELVPDRKWIADHLPAQLLWTPEGGE